MSNQLGKQQIWVMRDHVDLQQTWTSVFLPHPRDPSNLTARFLVTDEQCYEFKVYVEQYHSWLIDQLVVSDGKWYLMVPIDPIFLILPHLQAFHRKVSPLLPLFMIRIDKEAL